MLPGAGPLGHMYIVGGTFWWILDWRVRQV